MRVLLPALLTLVSVAAAQPAQPRQTPEQARIGVAPASKTECPRTHPVKGKINARTGTRIYHTPGGRYHDRTQPDRCFASVQDAVRAGYRAPQQ